MMVDAESYKPYKKKKERESGSGVNKGVKRGYSSREYPYINQDQVSFKDFFIFYLFKQCHGRFLCFPSVSVIREKDF